VRERVFVHGVCARGMSPRKGARKVCPPREGVCAWAVYAQRVCAHRVCTHRVCARLGLRRARKGMCAAVARRARKTRARWVCIHTDHTDVRVREVDVYGMYLQVYERVYERVCERVCQRVYKRENNPRHSCRRVNGDVDDVCAGDPDDVDGVADARGVFDCIDGE